MERNETGRIGYIDAMKGFAILCVVLGHVAISFSSLGVFPDAYGFVNAVHDIIYAFHTVLLVLFLCGLSVRPGRGKAHRQQGPDRRGAVCGGGAGRGFLEQGAVGGRGTALRARRERGSGIGDIPGRVVCV